jgi:hypothetical protein
MNSMYQFSLHWYLDLYKKALEGNTEIELTNKLEVYKNRFTQLLFSTISKSLFEKDKLLFAMLLYLKVALSEEINTYEEVKFLINKSKANLKELSEKVEAFQNLNMNLSDSSLEKYNPLQKLILMNILKPNNFIENVHGDMSSVNTLDMILKIPTLSPHIRNP